VNARRWVELLLPDAATVSFAWVRDLVHGDEGLLAKITQSPTARRLLSRNLRAQHRLATPANLSLAPHQQWLLNGHVQQAALARRLGIDALHERIRTTISAAPVAALRKELGEEGYQQALAGPALDVTGLEHAGFAEALERGRLCDYLISVGAALLETTVSGTDPFCSLRMRFAFSPACWRARPRGLRVDAAQLHARLAELAKE
jgi:hypothetical protein